MMSQDNRLLPLPSSTSERSLDRPLHDFVPTVNPMAGSNDAAEQPHLREYAAVILKRKWLILSLAVVVTSLVAIQMYRLPPIYQASTQIQIDSSKRSVLQTRGDFTVNNNDGAFWNTQLKLLQSPALARKVALTLDLQNNPAFFNGQANVSPLTALRRLISRKKPQGPAPAALQVDKEAIMTQQDELSPEEMERLEPYEDALIGGLTITPVEKTNLVYIQFTHSDPEISMKVANTLSDIFVYETLDRETSGAQRASLTLAKQIADLQLKIRQGEEGRLDYLRAHNMPLTPLKGGNLLAERLGMLSSQLLQAENDRKNAQAIYESAKNQQDSWSVPEILDNKRVQALRDKIGELEEKRAALLVQYTTEWPEVKKIDAQIASLKLSLDKAPVEVITSLKAKYEAAASRESKLRQSYNQERGAAEQLNQAEINLSILVRELETNKQYYDTLNQRRRELEITSTDRPQTVTVVNYSRLPREPVGPQRARNIIMALLLSLGAGVGLSFLLDYLDDTLKSVDDVDRYIHLPTLALIPAPRIERALLKGKTPAPVAPSDSTALALVTDVRSPVAEAYRHLRTSLLLSSAGQPPRTILVTSSQPSEGKTTTAVNTAMMLAQTGADVLIVDCDLRRPRLHTHFNLPNTRGLTNFLAGDKDLDSLLMPFEKEPRLKVLSSGPVPPNPAELIGSDEMRKLISLLSERFTHIIIDSPPTISFTDAAILSTMVDGVMLVVHGGRSSRAIVRRAKQQLHDVGAHIFGVVLNNVKLDAQDYYYQTTYYTAEYYEDEEQAEPETVSQDNVK